MNILLTIIIILLAIYLMYIMLPLIIIVVIGMILIHGTENVIIYLESVSPDVYVWSAIGIGFVCALPYISRS